MANVQPGSVEIDVPGLTSRNPAETDRMACGLLRNQDDYVGVYRRETLEISGSQTRDSWQVVFRIKKSREVKEIIVHKNCC